jgi:hypothetical protein
MVFPKTANELPPKTKGKTMHVLFPTMLADAMSSGAAFIVILTVVAALRGR